MYRFLIILPVLACFFFLSYQLSLRLISQIHLEQGETLFGKGAYEKAETHIEQALQFQPREDRMHRIKGDLFYKKGTAGSEDILKNLNFLEISRENYLKAVERNPLSARNFYELARTEVLLEIYNRHLYPLRTESPYQPLPYLRESVRLRPNSLRYNYALLRYLNRKGKKTEMASVVRTLVQNKPSLYNTFKKRKFWSEDLQKACIEGLQDAGRKGTSPRESFFLLSAVSAEEKNWSRAVSYYQKALSIHAFLNRSSHYYHLGNLLFYSGDAEAAETAYLHALQISGFNRESHIRRLYGFYKNQHASERFLSLLKKIRLKSVLPHRMDILKARTYADVKEYEAAKKLLKQVIRKKTEPEAYYHLALIAEIEKDWDGMEIAIQKATVYDPENSLYHRTFSRALRRMKKEDRAEAEAALAEKFRKK